MMDKVENSILNFLYKAEVATVESLTLMLAQTFRHPFSHSNALRLVEDLKDKGLVIDQASSYPTRSMWPSVYLTARGQRLVEEGYGELWDDAAYRLWLESDAG